MNTAYLYNPVITPAIVALIASVAVLIAIIKNRVAIGQILEQLHKRLFTRSCFFWTVNLVFMAVSVLHAGVFFGITGNGHDLPGLAPYLGFAVSFFLDLVTIILMQAMLESRYRGEEGRARQFLFFIAVCCGTSTFANLAISLNDYSAATMLPHAPLWVQGVAPYILSSFPLFVIMMSIAAEMIVNVRPLDQLNEDEYEADEKKRLRILEIRNTYLEQQANEELRTLTIRSQMKMNKQLRRGKMSNGFRWFWEKPVDVDAVIAGVTEQLKAMYEPQIESLKTQLSEVFTQTNDAVVVEAGSPTGTPPNEEAKTDQNSSNDAIFKDDDSGPVVIDPDLLEVTKNYPRVASEWLAHNRKTVGIEEIMEVTGHSKRRLNKAPLRRSPRNADLILITSVIDWLRTAPLPGNTSPQPGDTPGEIQAVNDEPNQPNNIIKIADYPNLLA